MACPATTNRSTQRPRTTQRPKRCGDRIDEDRDHGSRGRVTEKYLQRLNRAVVHVHAGRDRDVDVGVQHRFGEIGGDVGGNVERTGLGAVVADPCRSRADAERRHHAVEHAVVVVRGEDDDELGVVGTHELPGVGEGCVDVVKEILRRSRKIQ